MRIENCKVDDINESFQGYRVLEATDDASTQALRVMKTDKCFLIDIVGFTYPQTI